MNLKTLKPGKNVFSNYNEIKFEINNKNKSTHIYLINKLYAAKIIIIEKSKKKEINCKQKSFGIGILIGDKIFLKTVEQNIPVAKEN